MKKATEDENKLNDVQNQQYDLSITQSLYLKGMGILLIMLHNFFHWLPPKIGENEMEWSLNHLTRFWNAVAKFPSLSVELIWCLMGFFGVSVFIFLSGYGLTKSLLLKKETVLRSTIRHIVKIYILFLISAAVYAIFQAYQGKLTTTTIRGLLSSLSLTNNFYPKRLFAVNGPWWFFSLIIQLYLLFPIVFLFLKRKNNILWILPILYTIIYVLIYAFGIDTRYIFGNFLGHLPEFVLGCFVAKYANMIPQIFDRYGIFLCFCITAEAYYFGYLFPLSHIAAAIFLIGIFLNIEKYCKDKAVLKYLNSILIYIGIVSPFLFGFHGFFRKTFMHFPDKYNLLSREWAFLQWFLFCLLLASLFSIPKIKKFYQKLSKKK